MANRASAAGLRAPDLRDVASVALDRFDADAQALGDLRVGRALDDQRHDFEFTAGKAVSARRLRACGPFQEQT
jgi:hypothetical protein